MSEKVTMILSVIVEDNLSIEIRELKMHQGNPIFFESNSSNKNAIESSVTNITVQNSTTTKFRNETNYHAPVTINHTNIYHNKKEWKYQIKKIIYISIAATVISSLLLTLILTLTHQKKFEDDESIISE